MHAKRPGPSALSVSPPGALSSQQRERTRETAQGFSVTKRHRGGLHAWEIQHMAAGAFPSAASPRA